MLWWDCWWPGSSPPSSSRCSPSGGQAAVRGGPQAHPAKGRRRRHDRHQGNDAHDEEPSPPVVNHFAVSDVGLTDQPSKVQLRFHDGVMGRRPRSKPSSTGMRPRGPRPLPGWPGPTPPSALSGIVKRVGCVNRTDSSTARRSVRFAHSANPRSRSFPPPENRDGPRGRNAHRSRPDPKRITFCSNRGVLTMKRQKRRIHVDRTAGGDRDHRRPDRPAAAGGAGGARGGPADRSASTT